MKYHYFVLHERYGCEVYVNINIKHAWAEMNHRTKMELGLLIGDCSVRHTIVL
jgi:hypothetical protein